MFSLSQHTNIIVRISNISNHQSKNSPSKTPIIAKITKKNLNTNTNMKQNINISSIDANIIYTFQNEILKVQHNHYPLLIALVLILSRHNTTSNINANFFILFSFDYIFHIP